jgi:eukaryotic-like serine/threonine-protein kinase
MAHMTDQLTAALAGRYLIERELGQGGMALVYLARDVKHDRKVALKILRPELAAVIGAERFLNEIKVTANLQHPHILPLHDSGEAAAFLYYVMPFVEGETLRGKLDKEKQLGVKEAVELTKQVAAALDYAHRQGVIHRDIKPENVLIHDGQALVADFGIALAVSHAGGSRLTETGLSIGTPHYMSPEQAMGDRELDARSDVYSLGAMLYEMLTGEPPYTGATAQAIVARVITEEPRPLTMQRRTVPGHVAAAVHQALAKLPADRFASAAEFAAALENTTFGGPAGGRAGGQVLAAAGPPARRPAVIGLAAVAILTTAAAAWGWLRPAAPPAPMRMRIALTDNTIPAGMVGRDLAFSPDGRTIVFSDTAGDARQLWIKTADRADAEPLTGTTNGRAPTFSPDGEWIAFAADGRIRKVPRAGGSAVTIADTAQFDFPAIAWLESGMIAFSDQSFGLRMVPQDGGPVRRWTWLDTIGMGVVSIEPLPGGRRLLVGLCTFGCPSSRLAVFDPASGAWETLSEEVIRAWHLVDGRVVFVRPDGGVFSAPFDAEAGRFSATPVPVLEGVRTVLVDVDLALSRSGTLLYVPGDALAGRAPVEAVWVDRSGVAAAIDTTWTFIPSGNGGIALSPDGRRVALAVQTGGTEDIWIKELPRGPFTRLTFEGSNVRPSWTADGRSLLYFSSLAGGNSDLRRRRADGTAAPETLLDASRAVWEVETTPDTSVLIVRLGVPPTRDIYLLRRDAGTGDSAITPLVASDGYEEVAPVLSPDGRWLAYASNESGRYEVYVRPFPAVNDGRWQISGSGGNEPLWARSGRELFYRAGSGDLMAVSVTGGAAFSPGEQRRLFSASAYLSNTAHTEYQISPDDRRFLFKRLVGSQTASARAATAVLVQHWLTELQSGRTGR